MQHWFPISAECEVSPRYMRTPVRRARNICGMSLLLQPSSTNAKDRTNVGICTIDRWFPGAKIGFCAQCRGNARRGAPEPAVAKRSHPPAQYGACKLEKPISFPTALQEVSEEVQPVMSERPLWAGGGGGWVYDWFVMLMDHT